MQTHAIRSYASEILKDHRGNAQVFHTYCPVCYSAKAFTVVCPDAGKWRELINANQVPFTTADLVTPQARRYMRQLPDFKNMPYNQVTQEIKLRAWHRMRST